MVSSLSRGLRSFGALYDGAAMAVRLTLGRGVGRVGEFQEPTNLTVVHVVASWRILASFVTGVFWLAVSFLAYGTLLLWVLMPFSLLWFGLGAWLLNGRRFWVVYTVRDEKWSVVYDGLTFDEANKMADEIRNATGLRLRARGWKLPPGGRKG